MLRARTLPRIYALLAVFVLAATALVACGSENLSSFERDDYGSLIPVSLGDGNVYTLDSERTTSSRGGIPRPVKLALLLIGVFAAFGIGYWLRYRRGYRRVGISVLFLAALLYGAAIHLVAQAYHFPVDHPNLFLFWFLGVLPLAYVTRSQLSLSQKSELVMGMSLGVPSKRH